MFEFDSSGTVSTNVCLFPTDAYGRLAFRGMVPILFLTELAITATAHAAGEKLLGRPVGRKFKSAEYLGGARFLSLVLTAVVTVQARS